MSGPARKRELGRGERVVPGVYRLRLPLPWPGVPHCNAWAIAAGDGVVLVDTGMHEPGSFAHLERALAQVNLRVENVKLVVCTHAHSDHYGQAATVIDRTGCELWMHPDHEHMTKAAEDPVQALERRLEVARQSGVPAEPLRVYAEARRGQGFGIARIIALGRQGWSSQKRFSQLPMAVPVLEIARKRSHKSPWLIPDWKTCGGKSGKQPFRRAAIRSR